MIVEHPLASIRAMKKKMNFIQSYWQALDGKKKSPICDAINIQTLGDAKRVSSHVDTSKILLTHMFERL